MYTSSVIARAKVALQGSETEQRIAVLLYDDAVQVISSFELNQLASLSYHESTILTSSRNDMVEILLDHIEQITSQPINYSIISVQKALVVTKHLLLHGAQKVIPAMQQQLGKHIDTLREYNTVLAATQQQTTTAWIMRIKGGGVDTAGPVRDIAVQIYTMLCNPQQLQFERNTNADPNSLVPIGNRQQIAFVTDEVRYAQLKLRMQQENAIQMKSNLKKAHDGFGGGYMSTNGKNVVGAAHGIEEMLKQKHKEEQRFTDESMNRRTNQTTNEDVSSFSEYMAPTSDMYSTTTSSTTGSVQYQQQQQYHQQPNSYNEPDLLSLDNYAGTISHQQPPAAAVNVDLLDIGGSTTLIATHDDPFNLTSSSTTTTPTLAQHHQQQSQFSTDLLHQSYSTGMNPTTTAPNGLLSVDPYSLIPSMASATIAPQSTATPSMMNLNNTTTADRFSALDALVGGGGGTTGSSSFTTGGSLSLNSNNKPMTTSSKTAFADLVGPFATTATSSPAPIATTVTATHPSLLMQQQQHFSMSGGNTTTTNDYGFAYNSVPVPTQSFMAAPMMTSLSSIQVSQPPSFGTILDTGDSSENSDNGFIMGGSTGTGLIPTGHAPASAPPPPPPPPPSFY